MTEPYTPEIEALLNTPVVIGLEAQGHIPTVERMLADGESWEAIGEAIGWHGPTAAEWYRYHLEGRIRSLVTREAKMREALEEIGRAQGTEDEYRLAMIARRALEETKG
jgi:hypothetical protein